MSLPVGPQPPQSLGGGSSEVGIGDRICDVMASTRPPRPSSAASMIRLTQQQQFRLLDSYNKQQYTSTVTNKRKKKNSDADETVGESSTFLPSSAAATTGPIPLSSLSTTEIQQRPSAYSRFHPLPRLNQSVIKDIFQPKSKPTKPTEPTASTAAPATSSVTASQYQTMLEYAREHQLVYQPCCQIEMMLQEGIELLSEQRRINTLIRVLLSQSHPNLLPPPSRYGWCHLLANDEPHLRRHSLIEQQFLPTPAILDRLQERGIIQIPQLKRQFISEWNADQERRPHTLTNFTTSSSVPSLTFTSSSSSSLIAAAASRNSHSLYTSLDCSVCWSALRDGTELYKMTCCQRLVHLQCMNHIIGLKATAERRQCTACHQNLDRDELDSIKEEIVRTKQRKRFVTSNNRKPSSVQVNASATLSPVVEELSQTKEDDPEAVELLDGSPSNQTPLHPTPPPRVLTRHRVEVPSAAATELPSTLSSPFMTEESTTKLVPQLEPTSRYQDRARVYRASLVQRFSYALEARKSRFGEIRISHHSNSTLSTSNVITPTYDQQQFDMECDSPIARWMGLGALEIAGEEMDEMLEAEMELEAQKRLEQLNQQHPVTINGSIATIADNEAVDLTLTDSHPNPTSLPTSQLNQIAGSSHNSTSSSKYFGTTASHLTPTTIDHSLARSHTAATTTHLYNHSATFNTLAVPTVNQVQPLNHAELYDNDEVVPMELC